MAVPYPLAINTFDREEIEAVRAVMASGRMTMGERVRAFEREFAAWTGARHAVMVGSGSSANLIMVEAMLRRTVGETPWQVGDEILVSALSWPTTVWPLVQLGLVPVFVDIDPDTLAIDLGSAADALGAKTKGMFLTHVAGHVPDMSAYLAFCRTHGLVLLEDACESLGGHCDGRHSGTFGSAGSCSFYFSHHISTIEGGLLVTSDAELYDDMKSARAHGWVRDRADKETWLEQYPEIDERFMFVMPGYNVRPMELQAAIGSVQLRKLDDMLERRERLASKVDGWLRRSAPWLTLAGRSRLLEEGAKQTRQGRTHSWMTLPLLLAPGAPIKKQALAALLGELQVETRPIIAGNLARHPAMRQIVSRSAPSLAECDEVFARGIMIGCHPVPAPGSLETLERAIEALARL